MNEDANYEYEDSELKMQLPVAFRQKNGTRYFTYRRRDKDRGIFALDENSSQATSTRR